MTLSDQIQQHSLEMNERLNRFSLIAGAAIGAGAHVAANAAVKNMLKPGSRMQQVGSAIFQKGVRDAKSGRVIHPAVRKTVDVVMGPEMGHIYEAGLHSNRAARKAIATFVPENAGTAGGIRGIVAGRRSPWAERWLNRLPHRTGDASKAKHWIPGVAAGVAQAVVDPVLPAINTARSLFSRTKMADRFLKNEYVRGASQGAVSGPRRWFNDYIISPSVNVSRDLGDQVRRLTGT